MAVAFSDCLKLMFSPVWARAIVQVLTLSDEVVPTLRLSEMADAPRDFFGTLLGNEAVIICD